MEQQSGLKGTFVFGFRGFSFGIVVKTESIIAACFENMIIIIISLSQKFIINIDCLSILSHVKVAVSEPQTVFDLNVHVSFAFEQCDSSDPIP